MAAVQNLCCSPRLLRCACNLARVTRQLNSSCESRRVHADAKNYAEVLAAGTLELPEERESLR